MKKYLFIVLIALVVPGGVFASTYGKPYGATDETAVERSDVKTIDQLNRSTELEETKEPEEPVVEPEPAVEEPIPEPDAQTEPLQSEESESKTQ
ncbi:MAG: hypothetical protein RQ754_03350 [Desulfuromonadales bacterium]|nr:hypothetical protein [Desulfuromonadales bacterium]